MLKQFRMVLAVVATLLCVSANAEVFPTYASGNISNTSSVKGGLIVMLDVGVPTNCTGSPYGWMLIPEANKAMMATALTMWITGKRAATVYTDGYTGNGFCVVNQIDPVY